MAREVGTQVGPYTLQALLGAGGMGEVYKAHDTRLNRDVAIKFLHKNADAARFQKEARAIAALNHPNIVAIFDVGDDYLVTELVDGASLRARKPTQREALDYAAQIADGLAAAHAAGITHRDLKPDNIMVTRDGRVKILDFGLAQQRTAGPGDQTLTAEGLVMGTVSYMSPEQARATSLDARSDIFSFGATLYELLSGRRAFEEQSAVQTMSAVIEKDPAPLGEDVPSSVKDIVLRCLEKEPVRRFQSAADLAFALRHSGSVAIPKAQAKSFPWLTAALAAALALTIAFIVLRPRAVKVSLADLPRTPIPIEEPQPLDGVFSPDGKSILYTALVGEVRQVFLRQLDAADSQQLTKGDKDASRPLWSPNGSQFYFQSLSKVFTQSIGGSAPREIPAAVAGFFTYSLTPDGEGLLLPRVGKGRIDLQIAQPLGTAPRPLLDSPTRSRLEQRGMSGARIDYNSARKQILWSVGSSGAGARVFLSKWPAGSGSVQELSLNETPGESHGSGFIWLGNSQRAIGSYSAGSNRNGFSVIDTQAGTREIQMPDERTKRPLSFDSRTDRLLFSETNTNTGIWSLALDTRKLSRIYNTTLNEDGAAWSPDGSTLAFIANYSADPEVWLKNVNAGWKKVLFKADSIGGPGAQLTSVSFSPDGERLAVVVEAASADAGLRLYIVSARTGHASRVSMGGAAPWRAANWSADGKFIVSRDIQNILVIEVETGKVTRLPQGTSFSPAVLSPDGKWIADFRGAGVFLLSLNGKDVRQVSKRNFLTRLSAPAHCFSADGASLYLMRNLGERSKIERLDFGKDSLELVAELPGAMPRGSSQSMRLHPDGKSVVFGLAEGATTFWLLEGVNAALDK